MVVKSRINIIFLFRSFLLFYSVEKIPLENDTGDGEQRLKAALVDVYLCKKGDNNFIYSYI